MLYRARVYRSLILLTLSSAVLLSCGQMGPLYQPAPETEQAQGRESGADDD